MALQYGCVVDNWTWQLEVWALSNGGRWFSQDGKECTINDPAVIESIQKVADLTLVEHPDHSGSNRHASDLVDIPLQSDVQW